MKISCNIPNLTHKILSLILGITICYHYDIQAQGVGSEQLSPEQNTNQIAASSAVSGTNNNLQNSTPNNLAPDSTNSSDPVINLSNNKLPQISDDDLKKYQTIESLKDHPQEQNLEQNNEKTLQQNPYDTQTNTNDNLSVDDKSSKNNKPNPWLEKEKKNAVSLPKTSVDNKQVGNADSFSQPIPIIVDKSEASDENISDTIKGSNSVNNQQPKIVDPANNLLTLPKVQLPKTDSQITTEPAKINQQIKLSSPQSETKQVDEANQSPQVYQTPAAPEKTVANDTTSYTSKTQETKTQDQLTQSALPPDNHIKKPQETIEERQQNTTTSSTSSLNKVSEKPTAQDKHYISPEQNLFINAEAQMLLLPDDDIVEGELTMQAKLEQMDFLNYAKLFLNELHESIANEIKILNTSRFLNNSNVIIIRENITEIYNEALDAIVHDKLDVLRALVDNYPEILTMRDCTANNMLHQTVIAKNYILSEYLILRGIEINQRNIDGYTPLDIALADDNDQIVKLIQKATGITKP